MYLIGTDGMRNTNPLSIAMTSVIKNTIKMMLILNIARPPTFQKWLLFHLISIIKKPTIVNPFTTIEYNDGLKEFITTVGFNSTQVCIE